MNKQISSKVAAGGVAGAIVTILVWVVSYFFGVEVPAEVGAAAAVIIGFAAGWSKTEKRSTDGR